MLVKWYVRPRGDGETRRTCDDGDFCEVLGGAVHEGDGYGLCRGVLVSLGFCRLGSVRGRRSRTVPSPFQVRIKGLPAVIPLYSSLVNATKAWAEEMEANVAVVKARKRMLSEWISWTRIEVRMG